MTKLRECVDELTKVLLDNLHKIGLPDDFREERILTPNAFFSPPADKKPWIRISFTPVGRISTDASGCYEQNGCFYNISLFYAKAIGVDEPIDIIENLKRVYHGLEIGDLVVESADLELITETDNSVWFGARLKIYFTYENFTDKE